MSDADPQLDSWILVAIMNTMANGEARNKILRGFLKDDSIEFGPTFSIDNGDKLNEFLDRLVRYMKEGIKKTVAFTSNSFYGLKDYPNENTETHYQSYVVDTGERTILMIDPSRKHTITGIYAPISSWYIACYLTNKIRCYPYWLKISNPCQVIYDDIYCQSWTLFLMFKYLKDKMNVNSIVDIPNDLYSKYKELLFFYKSALPLVRKQLDIEWNHLLNDPTKIPPEDAKLYRDEKINIFDEFNLFKPEDIYDEERIEDFEFTKEYENEYIFSDSGEFNRAYYFEVDSLNDNEISDDYAIYNKRNESNIEKMNTMLSETDVRNDLLKVLLKEEKDKFKLEFGPTFTKHDNLDKYLDYLSSQVEKVIIFTCDNLFGFGGNTSIEEDHKFQSFIFITKNNTLFMIDPGRSAFRYDEDIKPFASMYIAEYLKRKVNTIVSWIGLNSPCQYADGYSELWTLYIIVKYVQFDNSDAIYDPVVIINRLHSFYISLTKINNKLPSITFIDLLYTEFPTIKKEDELSVQLYLDKYYPVKEDLKFYEAKEAMFKKYGKVSNGNIFTQNSSKSPKKHSPKRSRSPKKHSPRRNAV